jgi:hypothetical protein
MFAAETLSYGIKPKISTDTDKRLCCATALQVLIEVSSSESLEVAKKAAQEFLEQFGKAWSAAAAAAGGEEQQLQVSPVRMLTFGSGHVRSIFPR